MERVQNDGSERQEAAAWHDRLNRDRVSDDTRRAFADWRDQSPRHRELYESVDRVWSKLQEAAEDPQILALRHETALRLTRRNGDARRPLRWVAAAALFGVVLAAASLTLRPLGDHSFVTRLFNSFTSDNGGHYETAIGERLALTLRDGTQVTLDTQSELTVRFSPSERGVRLTHGQAFFEVAKDPRRPFVVETHRRRFVAVGTAFDVRVDGDQVKVTMVEGTVRVEGPDGSAPAGDAPTQHSDPTATSARRPAHSVGPPGRALATITAGEQLITDALRGDRVRTTDPQRDTSWRRGQVIFDNTRLADAIAELNRYSDARIELADPELADLRLSGAFATGQPRAFVEAVTSYFPVRVLRSDERGVVLTAKR